MNKLFQLNRWCVICSRETPDLIRSDADVNITVNGKQIHIAAEGEGPVDALSNALIKALKDFYPEIEEIKLIDYIVHIDNSDKGTAATVKVMIEMRLGNTVYIAKGVSPNILDASWDAVVEGIEHLLLKQRKEGVKEN